MRGGKHSTWERNIQCQNTLIYYPPGHTGRSVPPPTYGLVLNLRNVLCSEHLDLFIYLFIVKTEPKLVTKYHWVYLLMSEVKNDCSHFVSKKWLHADLNVKSAYGKESEQCLFSIRWRGMCKKPKATKRRQINTCKCNRKLELCTLVTRI